MVTACQDQLYKQSRPTSALSLRDVAAQCVLWYLHVRINFKLSRPMSTLSVARYRQVYVNRHLVTHPFPLLLLNSMSEVIGACINKSVWVIDYYRKDVNPIYVLANRGEPQPLSGHLGAKSAATGPQPASTTPRSERSQHRNLQGPRCQGHSILQ